MTRFDIGCFLSWLCSQSVLSLRFTKLCLHIHVEQQTHSKNKTKKSRANVSVVILESVPGDVFRENIAHLFIYFLLVVWHSFQKEPSLNKM